MLFCAALNSRTVTCLLWRFQALMQKQVKVELDSPKTVHYSPVTNQKGEMLQEFLL